MRFVPILALTAVAGALIVAGPAEEEASATGAKWLALLDDQKYEESWKQSASMFRSQVTQEQWLASLKKFREPLGSLVSRTPARVDFTRSLRGAPDGEYAIVHFTTSFRNKNDVTERLTLVKEDNRWQATAYAMH